MILPDTVTLIGDGAFAYCRDLQKIKLPDSVEIIGNQAFFGGSISLIKNPSSVVSFGGNTFIWCKCIKEVNGSENTNLVLVDRVLMNTAITQIINYHPSKAGEYSIQNTVVLILQESFHGCNRLTSITIQNSVSSISCAHLVVAVDRVNNNDSCFYHIHRKVCVC